MNTNLESPLQLMPEMEALISHHLRQYPTLNECVMCGNKRDVKEQTDL